MQCKELYRKVTYRDYIDINYALFNKLYVSTPEEIESPVS